jgi:hypothetical protein
MFGISERKYPKDGITSTDVDVKKTKPSFGEEVQNWTKRREVIKSKIYNKNKI